MFFFFRFFCFLVRKNPSSCRLHRDSNPRPKVRRFRGYQLNHRGDRLLNLLFLASQTIIIYTVLDSTWRSGQSPLCYNPIYFGLAEHAPSPKTNTGGKTTENTHTHSRRVQLREQKTIEFQRGTTWRIHLRRRHAGLGPSGARTGFLRLVDKANRCRFGCSILPCTGTTYHLSSFASRFSWRSLAFAPRP